MSRATPEGKLKAEVKAYLDAAGAYYFMPRPTEWGQNGVDFFCCVRGRFVAIETKIRPRQATPLQRLCLQQVRAAGGIGFVAYDMDAVRAGLARL
jgi:hypothetical protein